MTPLELLENQACEAIARGVASRHSPAEPNSFDAGVIFGADVVANRIADRQIVALAIVKRDDQPPAEDVRNALQAMKGLDTGQNSEAYHFVVDKLALAVAKLELGTAARTGGGPK
ncbi:MAG TPA: hypothetical protein VEU74_11890 [Gemmatimonadales bacterium]|nr:hypothetical protein [Gemmatimonadales bacterium]